jgi:hypothetical protein
MQLKDQSCNSSISQDLMMLFNVDIGISWHWYASLFEPTSIGWPIRFVVCTGVHFYKSEPTFLNIKS